MLTTYRKGFFLINLLKTSGYFSYYTFKKFYMILILRLCVLYGSQNKQRLLPYASLTQWFCITEVESLLCGTH
jgi:hypothetical protein